MPLSGVNGLLWPYFLGGGDLGSGLPVEAQLSKRHQSVEGLLVTGPLGLVQKRLRLVADGPLIDPKAVEESGLRLCP